jgi:uracil-DNA glycosylase
VWSSESEKLDTKPGAFEFGHGLEHTLPDGRVLLDSYHVSRQNTQTGRLTTEMFDAILNRAKVLSAITGLESRVTG